MGHGAHASPPLDELPAGQGVHAAQAPAADELPGQQGVHAALPAAETAPTGQGAAAALPAGQELPAGHEVQAMWPPGEKVPPGQGRQLPATGCLPAEQFKVVRVQPGAGLDSAWGRSWGAPATGTCSLRPGTAVTAGGRRAKARDVSLPQAPSTSG